MRVFPRRREFLSPFSPILPFFHPFFSKPCRILCSPRFPARCFPSSFHPAFFSLFPFLLHDSVFALLRCKPRYARKRKLNFWWNRSNFFLRYFEVNMIDMLVLCDNYKLPCYTFNRQCKICRVLHNKYKIILT